MSVIDTPSKRYQRGIDSGYLQHDDAQLHAVQLLDICHADLQRGLTTQGIYLWGPVGRGKTQLMDHFYDCLTIPARRQHFHHFLSWVHRTLFGLTGQANPLSILADQLAREVRVLCFDELQVADIGDAMLLGPLFQAMFERGITMVATSNQPPSALYGDGFNRERFVPAIRAMEAHLVIVSMEGEIDHRRTPGAIAQRYWVTETGLQGALDPVLRHFGVDTAALEVTLGNRPLQTQGANSKAIWCNFSQLCEAPRAAADFIELCQRFEAVMLSGLPRLAGASRPGRIARGTEDGVLRVEAGDRVLPPLARNDDSVRRFIALVDECYDQGVPLYIEAQVPIEALYPYGYLEFPFRRTTSRLLEMQLERWPARTTGRSGRLPKGT
jgi:cell division protein ZapE